MFEVFLKQIDDNLDIIVYILTLRDKRYDLFFKMMGGTNHDTNKHLVRVKEFYQKAKDLQRMEGMDSVVNPDGSLCKNSHFISIALLLGLDLNILQKKIAFAPVSNMNQDWLQKTFTAKEQTLINNEKEKWITKIKSNKS